MLLLFKIIKKTIIPNKSIPNFTNGRTDRPTLNIEKLCYPIVLKYEKNRNVRIGIIMPVSNQYVNSF